LRVAYHALAPFAQALLLRAGLDADKAAAVARLLALTDGLGRRTHGLAMVTTYLAELEKGTMAKTGAPTVVKDTGATAVWDGHYLPGLWLTEHAIEVACARADTFGIAAIAIARSHHIGCLAALVKGAADRGYVALIANSDPSGARVAPYGGTRALFTPNPFAFGYPGAEHPVLIDTCASITTTSMTRRKHARGEQFDHPWLLDAQGTPTTDPAVLEHATPRGSLQLTGGVDHGHKGFGLALMIETLSQALSGHGRADAPTRWGGNVYVQVLRSDFFAGADAFAQQSEFLSNACRENPPIHSDAPVRVPGDAAAQHLAHARREGVAFDADVWEKIAAWAAKLAVPLPVNLA
jgi:LDH2 family malate/lactate/ureidoglycolate dehydrogenase